MGSSDGTRSAPGRQLGRRVLVFGAPGSGKSTLARRLGQAMGLRVIHLDQLFWKSGWQARRADEMPAIVASAVAGDDWVFDGNLSRTLSLRAAKADTLIWLDLPKLLCFARVLRRSALFYGRTRPDMASGCPERFDPAFLRWAWNFSHHSRPSQDEFFQASGLPHKLHLTRSSDVRGLLACVEAASTLRCGDESLGEGRSDRP